MKIPTIIVLTNLAMHWMVCIDDFVVTERLGWDVHLFYQELFTQDSNVQKVRSRF